MRTRRPVRYLWPYLAYRPGPSGSDRLGRNGQHKGAAILPRPAGPIPVAVPCDCRGRPGGLSQLGRQAERDADLGVGCLDRRRCSRSGNATGISAMIAIASAAASAHPSCRRWPAASGSRSPLRWTWRSRRRSTAAYQRLARRLPVRQPDFYTDSTSLRAATTVGLSRGSDQGVTVNGAFMPET